MSICSKRLRIEERMRKASVALRKLQDLCEHTFATKVFMRDEYSEYIREKWYDCRCADCGKMWIEGREPVAQGRQ